MTRQISDERKFVFYLGAGMMLIGALLFASIFVSFALNFGDFTNFESRAKSSMFRAFAGMALLITGGFVRGIGARGLAGSGVVLDPAKARKDLEPYSRMVGGMVKDALGAANMQPGSASEKVVMIKCAGCGKLNEEDSKFCQQCGRLF